MNDNNALFDKIVTKFITDVLYAKNIITLAEYESIYSARTVNCLDSIVDKMLIGGE